MSKLSFFKIIIIGLLLLAPGMSYSKMIPDDAPIDQINEGQIQKYKKAAEKVAAEVSSEVTTKVKELWSSWMGESPANKEKPEIETSTAKQAENSSPVQPTVETGQSLIGSGFVEGILSGAQTPLVILPMAEAEKKISKIEELQQKLPEHKTSSEKQVFSEIISDSKALAKKSLVTTKEARKGSSKLPVSSALVPIFSFDQKKVVTGKDGKKKELTIKVTKIPNLDIGEEAQISAESLIPKDLVVGVKSLNPVLGLESLPFVAQQEYQKWMTYKHIAALPLDTSKDSEFGLGKVVTQNKVEKVDVSMKIENPLTDLLPIKLFSPEELKLVKALVLNQKGDKCHSVAGLFFDLEKHPKFGPEARFHLAVCTHKMGFYSEASKKLLEVIKTEDPTYAPRALEQLLSHLPLEYEVEFAKIMVGLKNKSLVSKKIEDRANYYLGKGLYSNNKFVSAIAEASKVTRQSEFFGKAQYIVGISHYSMKKLPESEASLKGIISYLEETKKNDDHLASIVHLNLGRMLFQQNRYKEAIGEYKSVKKDSPYWVEALIEQGWTQLQTDDAPGAIGNMYSLHSPYFKAVYKPESFVVRAIGYLNICQYGDAYRTLYQLEKTHMDWKEKIDGYIATKKDASRNFYHTMHSYLTGKSSTNVDGLPYQVIREVGRQKGFLKYQEALNAKIDEIDQIRFITKYIKQDEATIDRKIRKSTARIAELNVNLNKSKKDNNLLRFVNEWKGQVRVEKSLLAFYKFELSTLKQSYTSYVKYASQAIGRIEHDKDQAKLQAGRYIRKQLEMIGTQISQIVENNEFLRYEIFSGSGENIRYQVAGGNSTDAKRIPANVKPQKIMNWEFAGEYWEDEIGSYRSSLQNNCPERTSATIVGPEFKKSKDSAGL